jgi:transcriptional regulator with XRE-family HTH domain
VSDSEAKAFGDALREVRAELDLSQEEAAHICNIDRGYFGSLERAEKAPTLTMLWRLARGLEVQPSELLARSEQILDEAAG